MKPFSRLPHRLPALDPLSPIPPSRHPFQIWMMLACLFSGVATLATTPDTQFNKDMPTYVVYMWGFLLTVPSLMAVASAWWKDAITGLLIERVAMRALGIGTLIYGFFLIAFFGLVAAVSASLIIGLGIACLWRIRHIRREIEIMSRLAGARLSIERVSDE